MMIYNSLHDAGSIKLIELENGKKLRYGENPDQEGFIYEIPEYGKMEV